MSIKYLIVGAGFFGATLAERIATELKQEVIIIDRRNHLGGNCYSETDPKTGLEVHRYGTHIFHTNEQAVWTYLNQFTAFTNYQHKVLTQYQKNTYSLPINLATINSLYGLNLNPLEAQQFIAAEIAKEKIDSPKNLEEKSISLIGRRLYEAFIRGYTLKQWQTEPAKLPADVIARLPVRFNYNANYFSDPWQGMPADGYTKIFQRLLDNPRIKVQLDTKYTDLKTKLPVDCLVIYTGAIDEYFGYRFGRLGWRTVDLKPEYFNVADYQGTAVMNYADAEIPYTRIHEYKHLHPERTEQFTKKQTVIHKEYSRHSTENDEPYYPIHTAEDKAILVKYKKAASQEKNVIFGGRLGDYMYHDMDKTISAALLTYDSKIKRRAA